MIQNKIKSNYSETKHRKSVKKPKKQPDNRPRKNKCKEKDHANTNQYPVGV